MKYRFQFYISILIFFGVFASSGISQNSSNDLKKQLIKIEESIFITQEKIKNARDVIFIPELYFVLAEFYVEKGRIEYLLGEDRGASADQDQSFKSKQLAIEVYQRFIESFPDHANVDRALFFLAHEYREIGFVDKMIETYGRITNDFSNSVYWAESHLILGDYFLENREMVNRAKSHFEQITQREASQFTALAYYKLGRIFYLQKKYNESLISYERAVLMARSQMDVSSERGTDQAEVMRDSLLAMVRPYAEIENLTPPRTDALKYFTDLSPNLTVLKQVLLRLGQRLIVRARFDEATGVLFRLCELTFDGETLYSVFEILHEAWRQSSRMWPLYQLNDKFVDVYTYINKKENKYRKIELILRDFATHTHEAAKKSSQKEDFLNAVSLYQTYLHLFSNTSAAPEMRLNKAEASFRGEKFSLAGLMYENLIRRGRIQRDISESALQAYAYALQKPSELNRLEKLESRTGFRSLGKIYTRNFPQSPINPMILFNVGRIYYDERRFKQSIQILRSFIGRFPSHREATSAGQLILDSYNQLEDYNGLIRAGKSLISNSRIRDPQFKNDISEIIKQAEYRKIDKYAGDPRSREYAARLISFADRYRGTQIGDQALYDAFQNLKKQNAIAAFEVGERLLSQHSKSEYAQAILSEMGEMAIQITDYIKAADILERFARSYPKDETSANLLKTAAAYRSLLGQHSLSARNFRAIGHFDKALEEAFKSENWNSVLGQMERIKSFSISHLYWKGGSEYRLGRLASARTTLNSLKNQAANNRSKEREYLAHAKFLLASYSLKDYRAIRNNSPDAMQNTTRKLELLKSLTQQFNKIVEIGNDIWTVAALYETGRIHNEFADFIKNSPIPRELQGSQRQEYRQLLEGQANEYLQVANQAFRSCFETAEKFNVFSAYVKGCQTNGQTVVYENRVASQSRPVATRRSSREIDEIRSQLLKTPNQRELLMRIAQAYLQIRDYSSHNLVMRGLLDKNPNSPELQARIGLGYLMMERHQDAADWFQMALRNAPTESLAVYGMAGLFTMYEYRDGLVKIKPRLRAATKPRGVIHSSMKNL